MDRLDIIASVFNSYCGRWKVVHASAAGVLRPAASKPKVGAGNFLQAHEAEAGYRMVWVILAFAFGGIIKGAIGAGVPIIAIPVLAMTHDVQFAIAVLLGPNLVANLWQAWTHRADRLPRKFLLPFSVAGAFGVVVGTYGLTRVPHDILSLIVASAVLAYVTLRLLKPNLSLSYLTGCRLAVPVGLVSGVMHGSTGISAPISITFLNSLRLGRDTFVGTIAVFFASSTLIQVPSLAVAGILTREIAFMSLIALATVLLSMPVGARLAAHLSRRFFDYSTLGLLIVLAGKIFMDVLL